MPRSRSSAASSARPRKSWTVTGKSACAEVSICWVPSMRNRTRSIGCRTASEVAAFARRSGSNAPPSNSTYRWPATPPSGWPSSRPTHMACCMGASGKALSAAGTVGAAGTSGSYARTPSPTSRDHASTVGSADSAAKSTSTPRRRHLPASDIIRMESRPWLIRLPAGSTVSALTPSNSATSARTSLGLPAMEAPTPPVHNPPTG